MVKRWILDRRELNIESDQELDTDLKHRLRPGLRPGPGLGSGPGLGPGPRPGPGSHPVPSQQSQII